MTEIGSEPDDFEYDLHGERPPIDPMSLAAAPGHVLANAQGLVSESDEAFGHVIADDGSEHEVTKDSHEFSPAETAGKLWMRLKGSVEGRERALVIGAAGTLVSVAAALAIKKTISVRKKSG